MTYTALTVVAIGVAVGLDRWVLRTRLTATATWWTAYAIVVFFQLLTNGWLTGRGIVRYRDDAILGLRLVYAPIEDLGFGFALVLTTCSVWVALGRRTGDR